MPATVPFAEPPWLNGLPSPIFKETHRRWQVAIRAFIEEHLLAHAEEWERAETVPVRVAPPTPLELILTFARTTSSARSRPPTC